MSGPSEVKSVPEPAGKQLELPAPLLELLEVPPVEEPPPSSPDPELDVPLDDEPVPASSPPELVELVEDELELPLLLPPLLVPPLPDEVGPKQLEPLDPPDPLVPN
jgi:hypothetical protein